jgi:hypothetical protein
MTGCPQKITFGEMRATEGARPDRVLQRLSVQPQHHALANQVSFKFRDRGHSVESSRPCDEEVSHSGHEEEAE